MTTRGDSGSGSGAGLGSGLRVKPIDERLCELITAEVTHDILDATQSDFRYHQGGDYGDHGGAAQIISSRDCCLSG